MFKTALLTAVAVMSLAGAAQASTVDVVLGDASNSIGSYGSYGSLSPNITLSSSTVSLTGSAAIVPAGFNSSGVAAAPTGNIYGGNYLYVTGGSSATFSLSNANTFGLTWGSIDSYNTLTLTDTLGHTFSITGTDILNQLANSTQGTTQSDVIISDPFANIVSAVLTSTSNSFEAANFLAQAPVPLPPAAILFSMALVGLVLVGRRKQGAL